MLTIRYPNGQSLTYNKATFLSYTTITWELYTEENGKWIASIQPSAGIIIETQRPDKIDNPIKNITNIDSLQRVLRLCEIKDMTIDEKDILNDIKKELKKFDGRIKEWK